MTVDESQDLAKKVIYWASKGYEITYDIVNQIDNGNQRDVESARAPLHTFTVYVFSKEQEDYIYMISHDDPIEALKDGIAYCEDKFKDYVY
ncbi:hypothetical protein [Paenibacillus sp. 1781tsa1]|uniref:hypothetical protein n=1 Tax=Paenibacillus sp. 1781tsa1 TaxID=2953810 RepID=UPI00209C9A04|nr:hypothetical protein [Paenibacillus sp. 1781tsa1]MCP1185060.1 hypothetical protein [Paenibacillus sp. 1781tsa1]